MRGLQAVYFQIRDLFEVLRVGRLGYLLTRNVIYFGIQYPLNISQCKTYRTAMGISWQYDGRSHAEYVDFLPSLRFNSDDIQILLLLPAAIVHGFPVIDERPMIQR